MDDCKRKASTLTTLMFIDEALTKEDELTTSSLTNILEETWPETDAYLWPVRTGH